MEPLTEEQRKLITPLMVRLINSIPVNIGIVNLKGDIVVKNKLMKKMPISKIEEFKSKEMEDMFSRAARGKEAIRTLDIEINEKIREFTAILSPVEDELKNTKLVMLVLNETTEKKKKMEDIKIINTILKTILNIDAILAKSEYKEEIFGQIVEELKKMNSSDASTY